MKPKIHGRDHRRGGADPIPYEMFLNPSALMGAVLPALRLNNGFGTNLGALYIPDREGPVLEATDTLGVFFSHADPDPDHFDWYAVRIHLVEGLDTDRYRVTQPWESSPWGGGSSSSGGTGTNFPFPPFSGNWQGFFYGFAGVSEDDTDTVHFEAAGGAFDADEQFGWDRPGGGHVGYYFHDFTTSDTGDVTISFLNGSGPEKAVGFIRMSKDAAVTVGATVGEDDSSGTVRLEVPLTDDLAAGQQLLVVSASHWEGEFRPSDATAWPVIEQSSRTPATNLVPVWKYGSQMWPLLRDIGGLGHVGGDLDGGSP